MRMEENSLVTYLGAGVLEGRLRRVGTINRSNSWEP